MLSKPVPSEGNAALGRSASFGAHPLALHMLFVTMNVGGTGLVLNTVFTDAQ